MLCLAVSCATEQAQCTAHKRYRRETVIEEETNELSTEALQSLRDRTDEESVKELRDRLGQVAFYTRL